MTTFCFYEGRGEKSSELEPFPPQWGLLRSCNKGDDARYGPINGPSDGAHVQLANLFPTVYNCGMSNELPRRGCLACQNYKTDGPEGSLYALRPWLFYGGAEPFRLPLYFQFDDRINIPNLLTFPCLSSFARNTQFFFFVLPNGKAQDNTSHRQPDLFVIRSVWKFLLQ